VTSPPVRIRQALCHHVQKVAIARHDQAPAFERVDGALAAKPAG
jgi:hypothetical protein